MNTTQTAAELGAEIKRLMEFETPVWILPLVDQLVALAAQAEAPSMADALSAGDGTLHNAIDCWQSGAITAYEPAPVVWSHMDAVHVCFAEFGHAQGTLGSRMFLRGAMWAADKTALAAHQPPAADGAAVATATVFQYCSDDKGDVAGDCWNSAEVVWATGFLASRKEGDVIELFATPQPTPDGKGVPHG